MIFNLSRFDNTILTYTLKLNSWYFSNVRYWLNKAKLSKSAKESMENQVSLAYKG